MTRTSLSRLTHQSLGWALVLFLVSAPLASLLALTNEPACQMACCERKHHSGSCPRHQTSDPGTASIHFEASNDCQPNCSCAAIAPSAPDEALLAARTTIRVLSVESGETHALTPPTVRSSISPSLYQRPPPLPA